MQDGKETAGRGRGRPREFDPDAVLGQATEVFWARGFAATSLADLARAMEMQRPSIANAFGDKEAIYRRALAAFIDGTKAQVREVLFGQRDIEKALVAFYRAALDVYFASSPAPGCFVMCTAPVEALEHPAIRKDLKQLIAELDEILFQRFEQAKSDGQLSGGADATLTARLAQAVLHSLAIRARSGASKASLRTMAAHATRMLLGRL